MSVQTVAVATDEANIRLDRWFARHYPDLSRTFVQKLIRSGQVRVDGHRVKPSDRLVPGQTVRVPPMPRKPDAGARQRSLSPVREADIAALQRRILYQDADLIVIDKPAGLATQGGSGQHRHVDAIMRAVAESLDVSKPHLVHRLDKDTSGILLLARSPQAAAWFGKAWRGREVTKLYWAVTVGVPQPEHGEVRLSLGKKSDAGARERVVVAHEGRVATTRYQVLDKAGNAAALVALHPLSGRTHQLRVHCTAIGTPILGDGKYGGRAAFLADLPLAKTLHLHARRLTVPMPRGPAKTFTAPLPEHMKVTFDALGFDPAARADRSERR